MIRECGPFNWSKRSHAAELALRGPLQNIRVLENVKGVIKGGEVAKGPTSA